MSESIWTNSEYPKDLRFPSDFPLDNSIVEESGKRFRLHHVVVKLDSQAIQDRERLLGLPLWGGCKLSNGMEVFKIPGNWIRISKIQLVQQKDLND